MNRWTAPLVTAALLAPGAMVLGWNAPALASAAARPWTTDGASNGQAVPNEVVASGGVRTAPEVAPTSAPGGPVSVGGAADRAPTSEATRTVVLVHKTRPQPVEDHVSTTPESTPSQDERGTDSGAAPISGPVAPSDPQNPSTNTEEDPTDTGPGGPYPDVTTPDGTVLAHGGSHEERTETGCTKYYNREGVLRTGNCPPQG